MVSFDGQSIPLRRFFCNGQKTPGGQNLITGRKAAYFFVILPHVPKNRGTL